MPKKKKGTGKGKKKKGKGKKDKAPPGPLALEPPLPAYAPPTLPLLEVAERPAASPTTALPCRCGEFTLFLHEATRSSTPDLLCVVHDSGAYVALEVSEPYGQFFWRSPQTPWGLAISSDGSQQRADPSKLPHRSRVLEAQESARRDAASLVARRKAAAAAKKGKGKGKGKRKGKKGKSKKKEEATASPTLSPQQQQLHEFRVEYPELLPGWYGYGTHFTKGYTPNWAICWRGGTSGLLEITHTDEPADSSYRISFASSGGAATFSGTLGGDPLLLRPLPAAAMVTLSQLALYPGGHQGGAEAVRTLLRFSCWECLRPLLTHWRGAAAAAIVPPGTLTIRTLNKIVNRSC